MPFQRQNVKFTVLTIGVVMMVMVGVTGVVAIAYSPTASSTPLYTAVTGFVTLSAGQLLSLLRIEQAHGEIARTRHDIRGDLSPIKSNTEAAVHKVDEASKVLEQKLDVAQVAIEHKDHPCVTHDDVRSVIRQELRPMVQQIVEDVCGRLNKRDSEGRA